MIELIDPQPVGLPGLGVMALAVPGFFLMLALARRNMGGGEAGATRSGLSVLGIAIQTLGFLAVGIGPLRVALATRSTPAIAEGAATLLLMAVTYVAFLSASRAMGRNWSLVARTREDHELVTSGPFSLVRHPIYSGLFFFLLAMALAFGHWRGLVLGVPLYWIGAWLRVIEEERLLRARFGAAYDAYARRVKRFVPGLL
ncbi:isoprenylcysteine carboxylmethyltransferase family protein [Sphingomonas sp.]|uniref:methyltransferase family protein n=1 Tax=Sphingomonas sp. TaxID=28214 RepID=UPI001B222083|nr:isoprenylcysteine carboxylmethyltransferase family protein [Sphingomonas sp.]MBO9712554.1 isoprenylcysteine carboxylmethyltransferase family protein [Sphingomonas sp.]